MHDYVFHLPSEYIPYVAIITGVVMTCIGIRTILKLRRLSEHGIRTHATLLRVEENHIPRILIGGDDMHRTRRYRGNRYSGIYGFTDEAGNCYEVKGGAPYDPVVGDSNFVVLYNPQNPADSMLVDAIRPMQTPVIVSVVGVIVVVVGICMLVFDF
jgi:hypothetical protein